MLAEAYRKYSISEIQRAVAVHYRVTVNDLRGACRARTVTWPRMVAMTLSRRLTLFSSPVIGRHFGGRDHTTVLSAIQRVEKLIIENPFLAEEYDEILQGIQRAATTAIGRELLKGDVAALDAALAVMGLELAVVPLGSRNERGFVRVIAP